MSVPAPYAPQYHGVYDARPLFPGDLRQLERTIRETPWDNDRLERVLAGLYSDTLGRSEEYRDRRKELAALENAPGRPKIAVQRKMARLGRELIPIQEWFEALDRRVYLCHVQMAAAVNPDWRRELVDRYRFTLEIQALQKPAEEHADKADLFTLEMHETDDASPDQIEEYLAAMRKAWKGLKNIVKDARTLDVPMWIAGEGAQRMADLILPEKLVPEPPEDFDKLHWADRLVDQLQGVRQRCAKYQAANVAGIVALQEQIAAAWLQVHAPVEEAVLAEAVDAIDAEVVDEITAAAEILDAEVLEAEPPPPLVFLPVPAPPVEPAEPAAAAAAAAIPPAPTGDLFSLDLDDLKRSPAPSPSHPANAPAIAAATASVLSGTIVKPARNGRPPLKITYIRPGEPSPLAPR